MPVGSTGQNPTATEVQIRPAVHLPLQHLDLVHLAFDGSRPPRPSSSSHPSSYPRRDRPLDKPVLADLVDQLAELGAVDREQRNRAAAWNSSSAGDAAWSGVDWRTSIIRPSDADKLGGGGERRVRDIGSSPAIRPQVVGV